MLMRKNAYYAVTDDQGRFEITNLPAGEPLALAARRAARIAKIQKQIDELATTAEEIELPDDLEAKVREALDEEPERTWDEVLVEIMREHQGSSEADPT